MSGIGALLHRWLNSVFTDFNSTYFKSKNKGFLVNENLATHIFEFSILDK